MPGYPALATCPLIAAVILVCSLGFLIRNPVISVKNITVASLSLRNLSIEIALAADNPNPVGITLKTIAFDVYYLRGDDWIFLSTGKQSDVVIKSGNNDLTIPVNTGNTELFSAFFDMIAHGKITLRVKGVVSPDLFLFAPKVPFTQTMTIPLALPGR
jgi:LEA14-like dessication related protein